MASEKTLITVLAEITALLTPATEFFNGLESYQNLEAGNSTFPVVYLQEPVVSNHEISASNNLNTTYPTVLHLLNNDALEDTQQEHDVLIYAQRTQAEVFIKELLRYRDPTDGILYIDEITSIVMTNIINATDESLTGIMLEMDITINPQSRLC